MHHYTTWADPVKVGKGRFYSNDGGINGNDTSLILVNSNFQFFKLCLFDLNYSVC